MDYILSGNPKDVEKVIQENRIRIQRGVIEFTPLAADAVPCEELHTSDESEVETLKAQLAELDKSYTAMSEELSDACSRANELQIIINRLKDAGVDIDLILDAPTEIADVKAEPEADTKELSESDSKELELEDCKDVQALPEADTKTPKMKRPKKTE